MLYFYNKYILVLIETSYIDWILHINDSMITIKKSIYITHILLSRKLVNPIYLPSPSPTSLLRKELHNLLTVPILDWLVAGLSEGIVLALYELIRFADPRERYQLLLNICWIKAMVVSIGWFNSDYAIVLFKYQQCICMY